MNKVARGSVADEVVLACSEAKRTKSTMYTIRIHGRRQKTGMFASCMLVRRGEMVKNVLLQDIRSIARKVTGS